MSLICDAIDDKCRQADENGLIANVSAYPNPTSGKLNVSFEAVAKEKYSFKVFDLIGNIVLSQTYNSTEGNNLTELDLSKAANGLYFLKIEKENGEMKVIRIEVQ